jgi:bifunctional UDP-N-acetylglucosamine pyrophosphorylase/glucosamine-1-phosphate N-acetyltransferase
MEEYKVIDSKTTYIGEEVKIGEGTVIYPNVTIMGKTVIGKNNVIESNTIINNCDIGDNNRIIASYLKSVSIGNDNTIGPFAHLRDNVKMGNNNAIGNFVEIKNSTLGDNNFAKHLAFIGNCTAGSDVNFSAGMIITDFNWKEQKYVSSTIGSHVMIGSNSVLVGPIKLSNNTFVAAGSVITKDVEEGDLAIARERETRKKNYLKGE